VAPQAGLEPATLRLTAGPRVFVRRDTESYHVNGISHLPSFLRGRDWHRFARIRIRCPHKFPHTRRAWVGGTRLTKFTYVRLTRPF